jgi:hypothetical protein
MTQATSTTQASTTAQTPVTIMLQGFDTFAGSARSTLLGGNIGQGNANKRCDYTVCSSLETIKDALNISGSIADNFGEGSVDAKTQFVQKLNLTTYSMAIVVYTNLITQSSACNDVVLTGKKPPTDLNEFFQAYGDSYVSELVLGAEYMCVYVFYCQSEDDQLKVSAAINAKGITDAGQLSGDLQTTFQDINSSVSVRQDSQQLITGYTKLPLPDAAGVIQFALDFGSGSAPDTPGVISYGTTGYEHVTGVTDFTPISTNRALYLGGDDQPGLSGNLETLNLLQNQINWIEQVYQTYTYTGDADLPGKATQVKDDIINLSNLLTQIENDPTKTYQPGSYPSLEFGNPLLNFTLSQPQTWGGTGGLQPFQDITPASIISQTTLKNLVIRGGGWINDLVCTYSTPGSNNPILAVDHGQPNGGSLSVPLNFQDYEFITSIQGTYGSYVNQLNITTNKMQNLTFPPNPSEANNSIDFAVPAGSILVGFQGHCGSYLDQLQPILCTFSPATWLTNAEEMEEKPAS